MLSSFIRLILGAVFTLGLSLSAIAEGGGEPLLSIAGDFDQTSGDASLVLDLATLQQLPQTTFETSTIWTDGVQSFTGVSLADLMTQLGVADGKMIATAINDYSVEIPVSDSVKAGPIIAYLLNGKPMRVRDKGPLWIVYPYDSNSDYQSEVIYSRSIWQLNRLKIVQ